MENYINHLIKDIEQLIKKKPETISEIWDGADLKKDTMGDHQSSVDEFLYGHKYELQYIVGLLKETLPPSNRLTDHQVSILLPKLEALLECHHYELSYPGKLDQRTKYELLYKDWEQEQTKVKYGIIGIEFCHYNIEDCPIPGKCKGCEDFEKEYEQQKKNKPFIDILPQDSLLTIEQIALRDKQQKVKKVKDILENLEPEEGNIEGIFNFCNRWCEKCKFTDKCTNYQFEKELGFFDGNNDKEKMLEDFGAVISGTLSLLKSKIEELDIDLSQYSGEEEIEINAARNHQLAIMGKDYMKKISDWLNSNFDYFSEIASNLWNVSRKNYNLFNEHLETIGWHMTMIPVKLVRTLNPKQADDDDEFYWFNSNGTAKLVLECIDESIISLSFLFEKLSKKRDDILDFLAILSQIKTGLEKERPNARGFIRPGLDE